MNDKLDLSIRIWSDYYKRTKNKKSIKLFKEANKLCECFKIPQDINLKGKKIALENSGDKIV